MATDEPLVSEETETNVLFLLGLLSGGVSADGLYRAIDLNKVGGYVVVEAVQTGNRYRIQVTPEL